MCRKSNFADGPLSTEASLGRLSIRLLAHPFPVVRRRSVLMPSLVSYHLRSSVVAGRSMLIGSLVDYRWLFGARCSSLGSSLVTLIAAVRSSRVALGSFARSSLFVLPRCSHVALMQRRQYTPTNKNVSTMENKICWLLCMCASLEKVNVLPYKLLP